MSEIAEISVRAVRNLERGLVRHPRRSALQLLAVALGLDADTTARLIHMARHSSASPPPQEPPSVVVVTKPPEERA